MADTKISALTVATTPLAGTEVLPIVQSGVTKQVANNDLRPKQIQSNATSGVMQIVGPAAAATRVMTIPDANFTAARTDAAQTFTGNQTFSNNLVLNSGLTSDAGILKNTGQGYGVGSDRWIGSDGTTSVWFYNVPTGGKHYFAVNNTNIVEMSGSDLKFLTGNLVQGTAAKGVNFTANTPAAGMTSQLLNWYEEGTWTPTQGAGLTVVGSFTSSGTYTRVGRLVTIFGTLSGSTSIAASSGGVITSGYPFTLGSAAAGAATSSNLAGCVTYLGSGASSVMYANAALAAAGSIIVTASYYV